MRDAGHTTSDPGIPGCFRARGAQFGPVALLPELANRSERRLMTYSLMVDAKVGGGEDIPLISS
jgi:hypothetical protein